MKLGYWILILAATAIAFEWHGRSAIQQKWNIDKAIQAQQSKDALERRHAENATLESKQIIINNQIQKVHDEEIRKINDALANSERLRIGTRFCANSARQTNIKSSTSGDGTDTTSRLLSEEVDRAVKQLILESERVAATGRAAQEFIRKNGFAEE